MTETIGRITLDYTYYPGEDLYCDGAVEDELLDIVRKHDSSEFGRIIEEKASWPILYHLSPLRGNIVEWLPVDRTMKVLEVGAGCGAITGTLSAKAGEVNCIDLSKKRSHINAWRNRDCENVTIQVGNFRDIEPGLPCDYDYIFLIGVFEYGQGYIGTDNPYEEFLRILKKHIKPAGKIVIAIENKFGLKYFAGCREDHLGSYFSGIEDYPQGGGVRTFTRNGLEKICRAVGVENYSFYYPYPDYKFMTAVYSDDYLPKKGELSNNFRNFDRDRMLLFDEKNAFDSILKEGEFALFSNSYLLMIGEQPETRFSKYSNDRAAEFAIRTDIGLDRNGSWRVRKFPLTCMAAAHIQNIGNAYEKLTARYAGGRLQVNRCEQYENGVELEYLRGSTLEELLDDCLDRQDQSGFEQLVSEFCQAASYGQESGAADFDLIFSNVITDGSRWTILDYEWTFDKTISGEAITARSLYCYMLGAYKRREAVKAYFRTHLNYGEKEIERLAQEELEFQKYVTGQRLAMTEMRNRIGCGILPVQEIAVRQAAKWDKKRVQIYEDRGEGFAEDHSCFLEEAYAGKEYYGDGESIRFRFHARKGVRGLRIDPALEPCMLTILKLSVDGKNAVLDGKNNKLNGKLISENTIVFATEDPNITLELDENSMAGHEIEADLLIVPLPLSVAEQAAKGITRKGIFR